MNFMNHQRALTVFRTPIFIGTAFASVSFLILTSLFLVPPTLASNNKRPVTRSEIISSTNKLKLSNPGIPGPAWYDKVGRFDNVGSKTYRFVITDQKALAKQVGEGIFPNNDVQRDPRYRQLLKEGKLEGNHWRFTDLQDSELGFYKWASVNEDPGVKLFMTALMLERCGHIEAAIKALYAVAVHFPKTISYTYYKTPWYVAPAALDRARQLIRRNPKILMELKDDRILIENRYDNDIKNDVFAPTPGKLVAVKKRREPKLIDLTRLKVTKEIGGETIHLKQYENGHWELIVHGKPFPLKAITYSLSPIGVSPDRGTWNPSRDWQLIDTNKNGIHDGFFESYVDKNGNGQRDEEEPVIGDAQLLKDMGVNALRAYHHIHNKELFRKLHNDFGIHVMVGDVLGGYAIGSGAGWYEGTDYNNVRQRKNMLDSVRQMVEENKDEEFVLMWVLGNENIYGVANNSPKFPEAFYSLVNEAADLIHKLDPTRPVMLANGDLSHLHVIAEKCPNVDILGANTYRGEQGFGSHMFMDVKDFTGKPLIISEYGVSAFAEGFSQAQVENYQAMYLANNWEDMESNMAGRGVGNVLGGVLYEFSDEWWKANTDLPEYVQKERADWYAPRSSIYKSLQPENQDTVPQFGFPFLDGWSYEEWYGITSQGEGKDSPFLRVLRPAYFTIKEMWNKK